MTVFRSALQPSLAARLEVFCVVVLVTCATAGVSQLLALLRVLWIGSIATRDPGGRILLVPGKKLQGGAPDLDFRLRLGATLALADQAQQVMLLGGITEAGAISEAQAGSEYLIERNIAIQEKLLLEQDSTTTYENFRNARQLLGLERRFVVLSNRYHLARCLSQARSLGMDIEPLAAESGLRLPPVACLKETWYLHLFVVGSSWAKLRRHRELLGFLD